MNKRIHLKVADKPLIPVIHYVQESNGVPIEFWVEDFKITAEMECRFYLKKPSGAEIYNEVENSGEYFTLYPTIQTFAEKGLQRGQLQIIVGSGDNKKVLMSFLLAFDIEVNLVEESAVPSSNEFGVLDRLIEEAREAIKNANTATNSANTAAQNANKGAQAANTAAGKANTAAEAAGSAAELAGQNADAASKAADAANNAAKAANDAAGKIEDLVDLTIPVPIDKGGTGTDNRLKAASNLLCLPNGTVPTADTPTEWAKLGNCVIYINGTKDGFGFPSQYGTIIQTLNYENSATTVQQIWLRQGVGYIWNRSGNTVGWNGKAEVDGSVAWERVYTSREIADYIDAKESYSSWTVLKLDSGLVVLFGVRNCTFSDAHVLGDGYFRSIVKIELSAVLGQVYGGICGYMNTELIPQIVADGANPSSAQVVLISNRQIQEFAADVPMVIFGRRK